MPKLFIAQDLDTGKTVSTLVVNGKTSTGVAQCAPNDQFNIGHGADLASARAYEVFVNDQIASDTRRIKEIQAEARMLVLRMEHNAKELKRTQKAIAELSK